MASVMQPIAIAIGVANTTLYDPFIDATKERGTLIFLHLVNTSASDITLDIFIDRATDVYIAKTLLVPTLGYIDLVGAWTVNADTDLIKAIASATGVDATGTVVESDA